MNPKTHLKLLAVAGTAFMLGACATASTGTYDSSGVKSESHEVFDLAKITCWDMATLDEEDAAYAATLLYGYHRGRTGNSLMTPSKIQSVLGDISETCAGEPDMMVLDGFR